MENTPANRINSNIGKYADEWLAKWGVKWSDFEQNPQLITAVDLLTFTNPPGFVADKLRNFILSHGKAGDGSRGRPKNTQAKYDRTKFLYNTIKRDNGDWTATQIDNEIVNIYSAEDPDGAFDSETVRKWRNKSKSSNFI